MYWKDCLEEFLALKQAQGLCPRTIGDLGTGYENGFKAAAHAMTRSCTMLSS